MCKNITTGNKSIVMHAIRNILHTSSLISKDLMESFNGVNTFCSEDQLSLYHSTDMVSDFNVPAIL